MSRRTSLFFCWAVSVLAGLDGGVISYPFVMIVFPLEIWLILIFFCCVLIQMLLFHVFVFPKKEKIHDDSY